MGDFKGVLVNKMACSVKNDSDHQLQYGRMNRLVLIVAFVVWTLLSVWIWQTVWIDSSPILMSIEKVSESESPGHMDAMWWLATFLKCSTEVVSTIGIGAVLTGISLTTTLRSYQYLRSKFLSDFKR